MCPPFSDFKILISGTGKGFTKATLKKINIISIVFDYPINNLPINLEYIKICKFDYNNTISLPSQLKQIHILEYIFWSTKSL